MSRETQDALVLTDLRVNDSRGLAAVRGVSLAVRAGEVFGVAGVDGAGQVELMDALAGVRAPESGDILLRGTDITRASPRERAKRGLAVITEDRRGKDLSAGLSIAENLAAKRYRDAPMSRLGWLSPRAMATAADTTSGRTISPPPCHSFPAATSRRWSSRASCRTLGSRWSP